MENATQALLIAGGIFLGILTISMLVYMFNNVSILGNAQEQKEETERLAEWNAEWEAYNKQYLYGTDVLTVINKAKQNNIEYENNSAYTVNIVGKNQKDEELALSTFLDLVRANKTSIFTCEDITYNDKGRVSTMTFKFVE